MICSKCNHSWSVIGKDISVIDECPKCKEKVVPNYKRFESVSEGIYYCIIKGSKQPFDLLKNKEKFGPYIDDVLGNSFPDRNLIKNAIDSGVGSVLFDAIGKSSEEQDMARKTATQQLVREYSTIYEKAYEVVSYFTDALGWESKPLNTSNGTSSFAIPSSKGDNLSNDNYAIPNENNYTSDVIVDNNNTKVIKNNEHEENAVVKPKKRKKLGCFLACVIFILIALLALIIWLFIVNPDNPVRRIVMEEIMGRTSDVYLAEVGDNRNDKDLSAPEETELQIEETTNIVTEVSDKIEKSTDVTVLYAETKAETQPIKEDKSYSIRYIKENIDSIYNKSYDYDDDCIYQINTDYGSSKAIVSKISLSNGNVEEVVSIDKGYNHFKFAYNEFDSDVYLIKGREKVYNLNTGDCYDIFSDNSAAYYEYRTYFVFCEERMLSIISEENGLSEEFLLDENKIAKKGYVFGSGMLSNDFYISPFLHDDCYYWIKTDDKKTFDVLYTMQYSKEKASDCNAPIVSFNAAACSVKNNDVYFMSDDCTLYKLNMELISGKESLPEVTLSPNNIYSNGSTNETKDLLADYCDIIIKGDDIKQTGKANLTSVYSFYVKDNGDVVVIDSFDSTIKIIEKI